MFSLDTLWFSLLREEIARAACVRRLPTRVLGRSQGVSYCVTGKESRFVVIVFQNAQGLISLSCKYFILRVFKLWNFHVSGAAVTLGTSSVPPIHVYPIFV